MPREKYMLFRRIRRESTFSTKRENRSLLSDLMEPEMDSSRIPTGLHPDTMEMIWKFS